MKLLAQTISSVALGLLFIVEWWWLPIGIAQYRGNPSVNELWGTLGMLTMWLPIVIAAGLSRSAGRVSFVRLAGWLLGLGGLPSVYFWFRP
ncbi:hypothetical protein [Armatimonas rosea]|uniref:Uncharacterized protein n=1 Tax=Armatimonas rosea TaxID=685828 RepID=A0A7W9SNX3_ARMRO|nr:hypothetical protein [Armatimonas rosea]MBB6050076.1 hypothetical protein [Armatimonas rosea]